MNTPEGPTQTASVAQLKDWLAEALVFRDDSRAIPETHWERARGLLADLHRADGTTQDPGAARNRVRAAAPAHPIPNPRDHVATEAEARDLLQSMRVPDALALVAQRVVIAPQLVPLNLFRSLLAQGPIPWEVFVPYNSGGEAQAAVESAMALALRDPARPELEAVIQTAAAWVRLGRLGIDSEVGGILMRYARGSYPGQREGSQQKAAQCVARADAAPTDVLEIAVRFAGPDAYEVVRCAVEHRHAGPGVWEAAVRRPGGLGALDLLSRIPAACRVPSVWQAAADDSARVALDGNVGLRFAVIDRLSRMARSADGAALGPLLAQIIRLSEERAFGVVMRIGRKRLADLDPSVLLPLMTSQSAEIRLGMVSLMGSVGPTADKPARRRGR